jgi:catechol 2,3-dioxygenase-like lactoylglutathione lyase family enzyme
MSEKKIYGIQQIGVGVENVYEAWAWYRKHLGMDIKAFDEAAVAQIMLHYTEGKPRERHAVLAMNMQSGGGFEVWQHTGKTPKKVDFEIQLGDLGIFIGKQKTQNAQKAFQGMKAQGLDVLGEVVNDPNSVPHFFMRDPYGNIFQIVEEKYVFSQTPALTGGVLGAIIGVSDIDASLKLYSGILGYDKVVYDQTAVFSDLAAIPGGSRKARRILLRKSKQETGGFSPLFGPSELELVQVMDSPVRKIFENRIWGDPGFIHLCFDIHNISALRDECATKGFPFTVDSENSFDMGEAAGQFAYVSDPDGTPIEFVETHRLPILKAIGWEINLQKRDPNQSIPRWVLKALRIKRVK